MYQQKRFEIEERLERFLWVKEQDDDKLFFEELVFCTLTPQARPLEAQKTLDHLKHLGLLWEGVEEELSHHLHRVRFRYTKAASLVYNRKVCMEAGFSLGKKLKELGDAFSQREWVVTTMKGIGWKEASHFLRNIGFGLGLAILDRHVLRTLNERFGVPLPSSLSERRYLEYERLLHQWTEDIGVPFAAMDFVLFYDKTGLIFK
ncbi:8-oxoguanine DNA glycosylase [Thermospira aquatica]|uniref:DNA-(apurinic or apyrimidinic site) lyase n=1 Tax=Thermospira aquatica TaxID=2828656 RepID=A0AAX3BCP4_9SPIR|nr:hypothetical protein [Thermospira aquatica]URA10064.1 hypothetical protein KDW03_11365 [Thermospira aquatica]